MVTSSQSQGYSLRRATAEDAPVIRKIITRVHDNPTGLNWKRFILATGENGNLIGCGQVKPHRDGSFELASIAVMPEWRGKGIARAIITRLIQDHPGALFLTCRGNLGPMYQKFGFEAIQREEMPPHFYKLSGLFHLYNKMFPDSLLVMRRK